MTRYRPFKSETTRRRALAVVLAVGLTFPTAVHTANAGKEGVYLTSDVYFTLEEAYLSPGSTDQTFRFTLELTNHSSYTVDYNGYGAAVLDSLGNRYSAELTEKLSSRVKPGSTIKIKYASRVPAGVSLEDLKAQIFRWKLDTRSFFTPVGELSAAYAETAEHSDRPTAVFRLNDADSSYPADSSISVQLEDTVRVLSGGTWSLFAHLTMENLGTASLKLPAALQLQMKDEDGYVYSGTIAAGGDTALLPHQKQPVTVQFPVGELREGGTFTLQLTKKASGSASSTGSTANVSVGTGADPVLAEFQAATEAPAVPVGQEAPYPGMPRADLRSKLHAVQTSSTSAGVRVQADYLLTNNGTKAVPLPTLSGLFQLAGSSLSVAATDALTHPSSLGAGESSLYRFEADLPAGVDTGSIQLAVQEKKGAYGLMDPVFAASLPADSQAVSTPIDPSGSVYSTSIGKLALQVKASYRMATESGDDLLMTEVAVENKEAKAMKLPALVSTFTNGDVTLDGKAVRVQSSPYLNPGERTTLYIYAKVPYALPMTEGKVRFGEGTTDPKTGEALITKEWAALSFSLPQSELQPISVGDTWMISDSERQSTAQVIGSTLYDTDSGKLVAVRILQRNQELRASSAVPYAGLFVAQDNTVWKAQATEETGYVGKGGSSISTLWVSLPSNAQLPSMLMLGPKVDDSAFASPKQLSGLVWTPEAPMKAKMSDRFKVDLAPYHYTFSGMYGQLINNSYRLHFHVELDQDYVVADGSSKNRTLTLKLEDNNSGKLFKTWDIPLTGPDSLKADVENVLTVDGLSGLSEQFNLLMNAKLSVYDKFEGGTRLLGTISAY